MQKGKPFIQGMAQKAARPAVVQPFGIFLGYSMSGYGAMVPPWWGGSLPRGERRWEQVTAAPSPVRCCREGSSKHPGKLQALLWGPLFRCYLWSCHLGYSRGISGAFWPPAALRRTAAAALHFHLAVKHQNWCWPLLLPTGSQPLLAASLL